MKKNSRKRGKKFPPYVEPYVDEPNSFGENIAEILGIIVIILFVASFVYLVITGIPTIETTIRMFLQEITKI